MIPASVEYKRAGSVDEAVALLAANSGAKILAGGHSLIPAMKLRLNSPEMLIDIARIAELRFIKDRGNFVAIGAASTHRDIIEDKHIKSRYTAMTEAGELIGDTQIRNVGTLGGSIAHADPAADWPAVLLALDATVKVQGPNGNRKIAAQDFFTGFFSTALEDGEIVTEIQLPEPVAGQKSAYRKFMQPASRFAIVGCAACVTMENGVVADVKVGLAGVSDGPFREEAVEVALKGKTATLENIEMAANAAAEGMNINHDHFASQSYRKHLAKVYVKRALMGACGM